MGSGFLQRACALLAVGAACSSACTADFHSCGANADCGQGGICEAVGACSFEDSECASGRRYGQMTESAVAGLCVPSADTDAPEPGTTTAADSATSTAPASSSTSQETNQETTEDSESTTGTSSAIEETDAASSTTQVDVGDSSGGTGMPAVCEEPWFSGPFVAGDGGPLNPCWLPFVTGAGTPPTLVEGGIEFTASVSGLTMEQPWDFSGATLEVEATSWSDEFSIALTRGSSQLAATFIRDALGEGIYVNALDGTATYHSVNLLEGLRVRNMDADMVVEALLDGEWALLQTTPADNVFAFGLATFAGRASDIPTVLTRVEVRQ